MIVPWSEDDSLAWCEQAVAYYRKQHTRLLGIDPSVFTTEERNWWYWELVQQRDHLTTARARYAVLGSLGWPVDRVTLAGAAAQPVLDGWVADAERIFGFIVRPGQDTADHSKTLSRQQVQEYERQQMVQVAAEHQRRADRASTAAGVWWLIGIVAAMVVLGVGYHTANRVEYGSTTGIIVATWLGAAGCILIGWFFAWLNKDVYPKHPWVADAINVAAAGVVAAKVYERHEQKQAERIGEAVVAAQKKREGRGN